MKFTNIELGRIIAPAKIRRAGNNNYPILSMTMRDGLVNQADKFKKRIASTDTSPYKIVERNQLVVGFPIDEGVLAFQNLYNDAIVSPAYHIWNLQNEVLVDSKYLERFLRSPRALAFYALKLRRTTARRRTLPDDIFLSLSVPVPPLKEQERIVKLLDEADELRKLRTQADRRTASLLPSIFNKMFGDPAHQGQNSTLGELVQDFRYGTSNKSAAEGKPALRIPNVVGQAVNLDDLKFVPVSDSDFERLRLKDGDLLFVRTNGNANFVGRSAVFDTRSINASGLDANAFIYASYLIRARLKPGSVLPVYIQQFLARPEGRRALRIRSKTSAGQFNINTKALGTILVPIPPLPLQKEFARRVTEIRELEAVQASSRQRLDDLLQSLLYRAFQEEL